MIKIDSHTTTTPHPGTGFLFLPDESNAQSELLLITNSYNITGYDEWSIQLSALDQEKRSQVMRPLIIKASSPGWRLHPDSSIDLAALPFRKLLDEMQEGYGCAFDCPAITPSMIATDVELEVCGSANEVLVVGYPNGLWDQRTNTPVFSKGITATPPDQPFQDKARFLIDAPSFPGSSGSPVFSLSSLDAVEFSPKLLGVLHAGCAASVPILVW